MGGCAARRVALAQNLAEAVPQALGHYERGIRMACWRPVEARDAPDRPDLAHDALMTAILAVLAACLTRGRGDPAARARILRQRPGCPMRTWTSTS